MAPRDTDLGRIGGLRAARGFLRRRFWIESSFAAITGFLFLLTLAWHDWIETVFRVDPDHGNGSLEWLIVGVMAVITAALVISARYELRRAHQLAVSH